MRSRLAALAACVALAAAAVPDALAAPGLQVGLYDEAQTLFEDTDSGFKTLSELKTRVLRLNLYWNMVATSRPADPSDPSDPVYDWRLYDRALRLAAQRNIRVLLTIVATPDWANGGLGRKYSPTDIHDLDTFSYAAAYRYSGRFTPPAARPVFDEASSTLPKVSMWMAWNEPNSPTFLLPQGKREGSTHVAVSPEIYAAICNSVWRGVHTAGQQLGIEETVACGAMNPRGNNIFKGKRASVSPVAFLRGMKAAGALPDVISHHPYAPSRLDSPSSQPAARTTVTLGNIGTLISEIDKLYGKSMRLWITEYGYQTNPPDRLFGVSLATQALYLRQAYAIARKNPRIDMMLWFLLKDE